MHAYLLNAPLGLEMQGLLQCMSELRNHPRLLREAQKGNKVRHQSTHPGGGGGGGGGSADDTRS